MTKYIGTFTSGDTFEINADGYHEAIEIALDMVKEHTEEIRIRSLYMSVRTEAHPTIVSVLKFLQKQDRNGSWMEWLDEIETEESQFDKDMVLRTLTEWHAEHKEDGSPDHPEYVKHIEAIKKL